MSQDNSKGFRMLHAVFMLAMTVQALTMLYDRFTGDKTKSYENH